jgi:hypothetical protein
MAAMVIVVVLEGRTVPSFRIVLAEEKEEWKTFRNLLDKKERKEFNEMWGIAKIYVSACSNSVQMVPVHLIIISILLQVWCYSYGFCRETLFFIA